MSVRSLIDELDIELAGGVTLLKLKKAVDQAMASSATLASLVGTAVSDFHGGISIRALSSSSGYIGAMLDPTNKRLWAVDTQGWFEARLSPKSFVPKEAIDPRVADGTLEGASWRVMPRGSGWKFPFATSTGHILGGWNESDKFWTNFADDVVLPQSILDNLLASQNLMPLKSIAMWGDSLTAGAGGGGTTMASVIALLTGLSVTNLGIGGQTSLQIPTRQGGLPLLLTLAGDTIPASGGVAVTAKSSNILYNSGVFEGSRTGVLLGIPGTISTDSAGNWTFTRTTAGSAVACPPNSVFTINQATTYEKHTIIIGMGRNGGYSSDPNVLVDQVCAMVARLTPQNKRCLVWSIPTGAGEIIGTANYNGIKAANERLALIFGDRFVDIRSYLIKYGLAEAGLTPTANDLADIAGDTIPRQLLADGLHWTAAGYTVGGNLLARVLKAKGWV